MSKITAVIINYNGIATILDTIRSIITMRDVECKIIVVDDGSTDGSQNAIRHEFPDVLVYEEPHNTRQVNRLRNKGLALADTDKVFLTDNDVKFDPDCIAQMLHAMESDGTVGACIPRLMYLNDETRIMHAGGKIHYIGATTAANRDTILHTAQDLDATPTLGVGGGIALFDMEKIRKVGGFDEEYELAWGDDGELHQRLLLAGYKCLYVPSAIGFHEYKPFDRTRHYRARGQIHNRWRFILTHYSIRTLVLIAPALMLYEILQGGFYLIRGIPLLYLLGTIDAVRRLPTILTRRRFIQALRVTADKDILFAGPLYVRIGKGVSGFLTSAVISVASFLLSVYWRIIYPVLEGRDLAPSECKGRPHSY